LLNVNVLERLFQKEMAERAKNKIDEKAIHNILDIITDDLKHTVQAQTIAKRTFYFKNKGTKKNESTLAMEAIKIVDQKWGNLDTRLDIVPGKNVLSTLRTELQMKYKINLTDHKIINEFRKNEIPPDLMALITDLENYRTS
jgi:Zn/Cd-binding protein ZinT